MDISRKLAILKTIAGSFNRAGITWALGASMMLHFKGIVPSFHDIDLMVANADIDEAKAILDDMGVLQPANPNSKYKTKVFLEYVIDGVDVDVMAGFAIVSGDGVVDCSLEAEQIVEHYDLMGEKVPLQSLALWQRYYELMGRADKVELIRSAGKR